MAEREKIVFLDVATSAVERVMASLVPEGFELVFARADTEDKAVAAASEADYLLVWSAHLPARVIEAAKKVKLIQKVGEGTDRIDVAAAGRLGIPVVRTAGSNSASVAELATLLTLATMRRLINAHNSLIAGQWLKFELRPGSYELRGKQVGIVGLGKIGKMVARQMQGFGASVVYYDAFRLPVETETAMSVTYMPLDQLLGTSDVITLHVPSLPSTKGMIGAREIGLMKSTAILINTCRAAVVDEGALYKALKENRIRGAGIDVFVSEPAPRDHPFFSLDNVIVTPHFGGGTEDAETEGIRHAFANIVRVSRGEALDALDYAAGSIRPGGRG